MTSTYHIATYTRHGYSGTRVYRAWKRMMQRCYAKEHYPYENYGGRGISVCERWKIFENFLADMGEPVGGMTLERNNTNGNYEPSNCRWASPREQANNRRNKRVVIVFGQKMNVSEACALFKIDRTAIHSRVKKTGCTHQEAAEWFAKKRPSAKDRLHSHKSEEYGPHATNWELYVAMCMERKNAKER